MENCIFCKIVAGEIPCFKVWEDDRFVAFLTIRPIREGHTLLIPKAHVEDVISGDNETIAGTFVAAKHVAEVLKQTYGTPRVAMLVVGLEVPHLHVHLVPTSGMNDVDFSRVTDVSPDSLAAVAKKISGGM
jgi:histidine triad (HIT) family protein